ncbi:MAG: tRNA (N6-threonylcarbamoyladenosine(37)-N6)-methyltransferase TrmO [Halapricum sp.]
MEPVTYEPIGEVRSPFDDPDEVPVDPDDPNDAAGRIELADQYEAGLDGLDGFSYVTVLAHLHRSPADTLRAHPPFADIELGVFATASPNRPNPIAQSIVALDSIEGATLHVEGLDLIDGTPVLDLKPFAPKPALLEGIETGWIGEHLDQDY